MAKEYEEICCEIIAMTAEALLVSDGDVEGWVPLSTIDKPRSDWIVGQSYIMNIEVWKLEDGGFI
jgi:hypothetical protein